MDYYHYNLIIDKMKNQHQLQYKNMQRIYMCLCVKMVNSPKFNVM